jgi:hypothetical protein
MPNNSQRIRLLALLLSVAFLAAQFHFCADLTSGPSSSSHFCPLCSTASSAVAPQSPSIAIVPVTNRLVVPELILVVSSALPRAISPRAPPAL